MHYYAWARLARDPGLPEALQSGLAALLVFAALLAVPAFSRALPHPLAGIVHLAAFGWMGALFIVDAMLVAGDLCRLLVPAAIAGPLVGTQDPHRLQALATVALGLPLITHAFVSARRPPPLKVVAIAPEGWPRGLDGLKIVQLSDVHVSPDTSPREMEQLVDAVNAQSPDLIVLTGDMVDGSPRQLARGIAPFSRLRARLGIFAVTGNHEYYSGGDAWIDAFEKLGVRVLQNEAVVMGDGASSFVLAGVPDWTGGQFGARHRPQLAKALEGAGDGPVVLLAHQPKQFPEAARRGVALQLSGHTHGGQIWPFTLLVALAERHVAGLHRAGRSQIYVSRGTRYWGPPMRLLAPHELTVITLRSEPSSA